MGYTVPINPHNHIGGVLGEQPWFPYLFPIGLVNGGA